MKNPRSILFGTFLGVVLVLLGAAWRVFPSAAPHARGAAEPRTFAQMVAEALNQVPAMSAAQVSEAMHSNPDTLVVDVRDAGEIAAAGIIPGAVNISLGTLAYKADNEVPPEWRDPNLANRSRPIITTCTSGEMAALAGKLLMDMGFTNVHLLKGGTLAWQAAGYSVQALTPGWAYHYDPSKNHWYAEHYAMTADGLQVNGTFETGDRATAPVSGCQLAPYGADC